jgi:hypothetical protein
MNILTRRQIVRSFLRSLDESQKRYSASSARGTHRGFSAVHDFTDANQLLLDSGCPAPDGTSERMNDLGLVIAAITNSLIANYS